MLIELAAAAATTEAAVTIGVAGGEDEADEDEPLSFGAA